jgi:uncharacterized protein (TIGR02147 family)
MRSSIGYQDILKQALAKRCERNPRYSLRAFARDLDVSPSYLCEIMKGKHKLTRQVARTIATRLLLDASTRSRFDSLVGLANATDSNERERYRRKLAVLDTTSSIDQDKFEVIGNWRDLVALQAMILKDHVASVPWLAERLGQSIHWAEDCVRRFKQLRLIKEQNSKWVPTFNNLSCESSIPSKVIRRFHKGLLRKVIQAVDFDINTKRSDALILAVKKDQLPAAYERLKSFVQEFDQEFGVQDGADMVYAVSLHFFPLVPDVSDSNEKINVH